MKLITQDLHSSASNIKCTIYKFENNIEHFLEYQFLNFNLTTNNDIERNVHRDYFLDRHGKRHGRADSVPGNSGILRKFVFIWLYFTQIVVKIMVFTNIWFNICKY